MEPGKRRRTNSPPPFYQTQQPPPAAPPGSHNTNATTLPSPHIPPHSTLLQQQPGPSGHQPRPLQPSEEYKQAHIALEETLFYLSQKSAAVGGRHVTTADLTMLQRDFATFMNAHPTYSRETNSRMEAPALHQQPHNPPAMPQNQNVYQEAVIAQQPLPQSGTAGGGNNNNNLHSVTPSGLTTQVQFLPAVASSAHLQDIQPFDTQQQQQQPLATVKTEAVPMQVGTTATATTVTEQQQQALQLEQVFQTLDFEAISKGDLGPDAQQELQDLISLLGSVAAMQEQNADDEGGGGQWAAAAVTMLQEITGTLPSSGGIEVEAPIAGQQQQQQQQQQHIPTATLRTNIPIPAPNQASAMIESELEKKAFLAALRQQQQRQPPR